MYVAPNVIAVGDPVKKDDYDKLSGNSSDHEARILATEAGASAIELVDTDIKNLIQYANSSSTLEGLIHFQVKQNLTLNGAILTDLVGSTSGTIEFDVKKSSAVGGTYSTVFSTLPSVTGASPVESTNAVFSTTSVATGDWIRVDITSVAVGAKSINIALTASAA